jgi:hypothetical protein
LLSCYGDLDRGDWAVYDGDTWLASGGGLSLRVLGLAVATHALLWLTPLVTTSPRGLATASADYHMCWISVCSSNFGPVFSEQARPVEDGATYNDNISATFPRWAQRTALREPIAVGIVGNPVNDSSFLFS